MKLTEEQQVGIDNLMHFIFQSKEHIHVLEGFSGTGKSTLVTFLLDQIDKKHEVLRKLGGKPIKPNISLTATTNKAADVLSEKTGREVKTVQSFFGLRVVNDFKNGGSHLKTSNTTQSLSSDQSVVVDEISTAGQELKNLIEKLASDGKLIYIGDPAQLAPVGELTSPVFAANYPTTKLVNIQRNAGPIAEAGAAYRKAVVGGAHAHLPASCAEIIYLTGEEFKAKVDSEFTADKSYTENKILAWKNQTVINYNSYVRGRQFSDPAYQKGEVLIANTPIFQKGKIVHNTDSFLKIAGSFEHTLEHHGNFIKGVIYRTNVDTQFFMANNPNEVQAILNVYKKAKEWSKFYALKEKVADARSTHALTVHKSQGSTFKNVYMDITDVGKCFERSTFYRLMYVGMTRASEKLYLYGNLPSHYQ